MWLRLVAEKILETVIAFFHCLQVVVYFIDVLCDRDENYRLLLVELKLEEN